MGLASPRPFRHPGLDPVSTFSSFVPSAAESADPEPVEAGHKTIKSHKVSALKWGRVSDLSQITVTQDLVAIDPERWLPQIPQENYQF
jgi:hypothetical protein